MTSITRKVLSTLKTAYDRINPSTLNGAIDIIVVQQEDGSLRCTPFHVRFGKLGVLQSLQNKVYITINDIPVEDLYMQLGEAGEAVFIEENLSTTNIQPVRHLEPSDSSIFLDPDNAITLFSDENSHKHLTNIDCSPQIINQQLDKEKLLNENQQTPEHYISDDEIKSIINIDVIHSNTIVSSRRRVKRRLLPNRLYRQISEDDEQNNFNRYSSIKRRSRARKRDSTPITTKNPLDLIIKSTTDDKFRRSIKLLRKRSASENDLPIFPFDFELTPFVDAHSRFNSIDSRPKPLNLNETTDNNDEHFSIDDDEENIEQKNIRALSNPIIIEQIYEPIKTTEESDVLNSSVLSKSAPLEHLNANNLRISQSDDPTGDFYSPTSSSSYESPPSPRPTSPKSDTEYELEKSSPQTTNVGWRWKWGELPEQRQSVFRYLWPSSKKNPPKEGIYLEDITSNRVVDPSRYLPQLDYHQQQQRTTNDDDQESGTGNSIPQSPFREHEASCLLGDAQLSLCGNINKQTLITDDIFNAHLISFETFVTNPAIINDPNLVVRIGGKYYNWNVASALITATSIFHKQLPVEAIEQLQEKHMAQTKPRTTGGGWWPSFYSKKSDMKNETSKVTTPSTGTDALAEAAKSEVVPTPLNRHNSMDSTQTKVSNKRDNDSEQEDSEVRKITANMEEKAQRPQTSSTHQTILKKTMILSSDQLKRLNLKLGMNKVEFSVTTALQGTTIVESNIYYFDHMTKFVISDIDGTITKSDVLGHIIPLLGGDWSHDGIAEFFNAIQENGYQFIYLSARAIGQSQITRNFLKTIKQSNRELPIGPLFISPDTLMTALYREVIAKKPEDFKIECLKNIASLFPGKNPFYAGFGNKINDQWAYTAVGIPVTRIYTINPRSEVVREKLSQALSTNYKNLHEIVDLLFPPMDSFSASETYSSYTYWRQEPPHDAFEDEMRAELEEIARRQQAAKSSGKTKGTSTTTGKTKETATATTNGKTKETATTTGKTKETTTTTGKTKETTTTAPSVPPAALPRTTPITTVLKPGGEPLLNIAQATENTVKRS